MISATALNEFRFQQSNTELKSQIKVKQFKVKKN